MNELMNGLRLEHRGLGQLLGLLQNKLRRLERGILPNFNLLADAIHYIENYATLYHHPKEDVIYRYMIDRQLDDKGQVMNVMQEHSALAQNTQNLKEAVDAILSDTVVSRDKLVALLRKFIGAEMGHLKSEETVVFPLVEKLLTDEDWKKITPLIATPKDDPLFGKKITEEYRDLYNRLLETAEG
jgi:hemerythrin-like domain-containing protein